MPPQPTDLRRMRDMWSRTEPKLQLKGKPDLDQLILNPLTHE